MKNLTRYFTSLLTGLFLIFGLIPTLHAITCSPLIVNTTADSNDGACTPGTCSLRDAITDANNGCPGDITFANGVTGTITLGSSLPDITASMNIIGPGSTNLTISGNDSVAPLNITTGVGTTVNISNLSISHAFASNGLGAGIRISSAGDVIVDNCELDHNANVAFGSGGAVGIQGGNVTLSNDVITTNSASSGTAGGINVLGGSLKVDHSQIQGNLAQAGGGLSIGENAFVLILNSSISDNHADANSEGGGIENFRGEITIDSSTIGGLNPSDGNTAGDGGGIHNDGGTITISNSTIGNNSSAAIVGGGGILNTRLSGNNNGVLVVENSTFVDNQAGNEGGGIGNYSGGDTTIINSTFTGNSAPNGGGALYNDQTMQINDVTLSENTATNGGANIDNDGVLKISNSIVSNSSGTNCVNTGLLNSLGNNLDNGTSCSFTKPGDLSNTDPLLDPLGLQDNGGPTMTIALQAKSPALDAASSTSSETEDQRGISRPQGSAPDIGAFELEVTPAPTPSNKGGGGGCALGGNGSFASSIPYGWTLLLLVVGVIWTRRARGNN